MEEGHHHRGALRRRGVAKGNAAAAAAAAAAEEIEQERRKRAAAGGDPGVRRGSKERPADCNSCRICRQPWASSGAHRICCIPCGHVYGRSCLEALLARCGGTTAKCLSCSREFQGKDMLNLYLQHTEEQMITTHQQEAPAARMQQVPAEDQQEVAWQQTVAAMVAEAQQRAEMARKRAGLTREVYELGRKEAIALKIMLFLILASILFLIAVWALNLR